MLTDEQCDFLVQAQMEGRISGPLMQLLVGLAFAFSNVNVRDMITCLLAAAEEGQDAGALVMAFRRPNAAEGMLGHLMAILLDPLKPDFLHEVAEDLDRRRWRPDPGTMAAMFQAMLDLPDNLQNKADLRDQAQLIMLAAQGKTV